MKSAPLKNSFVCSLLQCRTLPKCTSQVQIKQHADITIPCPANNVTVTNGQSAGENESGQRLSTVQSSVCVKISQSQSPKITLTSHPSAEDKTVTEDDGVALVSMETYEQQTTNNYSRADTLSKKPLIRSTAIDRSDSSGGKYFMNGGMGGGEVRV